MFSECNDVVPYMTGNLNCDGSEDSTARTWAFNNRDEVKLFVVGFVVVGEGLVVDANP